MGIQGTIYLTIAAYIIALVMMVMLMRFWLTHRANKKREANLKRIAAEQLRQKTLLLGSNMQ